VSLALARWLLRRRKRWLERRVVGVPDYERKHSLDLDRVIKALGGSRVNPHLDFLLSCIDDSTRVDHPDHLADLRKSGLTDEIICMQKITDVPPSMIDLLLEFATPKVRHAYLIPFPDPRGGWMDHIRMKVFPALLTDAGTIRYLQPRRSGVRIFFPLVTLDVLRTADPLYIVEGEKKALSTAQLGLPAIGICGIQGWHAAGDRNLHPDLDVVDLRGREVNILPDGDWQTNLAVNRGVQNLVAALDRRDARTQIVSLAEVAA
jgi:hypothetical protein